MVKVTIAHFARILTVTLLLIYKGILTVTQQVAEKLKTVAWLWSVLA